MSLRLLAVDTTSDFGSIAISENERIIDELAIESPEGFGHVLFDEILRMLARHSLRLDQLDGFAAASGPGSFTGVRIGLTAIKGLAEGNGKRAVAVSNLQALALAGSRQLRAPIIDARRGEVYGAVYDASMNLIHDEVVTPLDRFLASLPSGDLELVVSGIELPPHPYPVASGPRALAGAVAKIAARQFSLGCARDPAEIDANYVRRSDAELLWRDPLVRDQAQPAD